MGPTCPIPIYWKGKGLLVIIPGGTCGFGRFFVIFDSSAAIEKTFVYLNKNISPTNLFRFHPTFLCCYTYFAEVITPNPGNDEVLDRFAAEDIALTDRIADGLDSEYSPSYMHVRIKSPTRRTYKRQLEHFAADFCKWRNGQTDPHHPDFKTWELEICRGLFGKRWDDQTSSVRGNYTEQVIKQLLSECERYEVEIPRPPPRKPVLASAKVAS